MIDKLNSSEYIQITESIANGFFDSDGNYAPHFGWINAMIIFYNTIYKTEEAQFIKSLGELDELLSKDESFYKTFEEATFYQKCDSGISFNEAYHDAIDIVDYKKSKSGVLNSLFNEFRNFFGDTKELATNENLETLQTIAQTLRNGDLSKGLIDAYGKSDRAKVVLDSIKAE